MTGDEACGLLVLLWLCAIVGLGWYSLRPPKPPRKPGAER
jgi:hypothetical protein